MIGRECSTHEGIEIISFGELYVKGPFKRFGCGHGGIRTNVKKQRVRLWALRTTLKSRVY